MAKPYSIGDMSERKIKIFCRYFHHALWFGVGSAAFGWGAVVGAVILALLGFTEMIQAWTEPIASAAFAVMFVFAIHFFIIAPYRAIYMLWPFSIKVVAGHLKTPYPPGPFEPQKAALLVRNRSYLPQSGVMHIMSIVDNASDDIQFPRFVTEFSVQPNMTRHLVFVTWTLGNPPYENDRSIFLSGPVGPGFGGNIAMLPVGSHNINLRIGIPDGVDIYIRCRVWIEGDSLKAVKL